MRHDVRAALKAPAVTPHSTAGIAPNRIGRAHAVQAEQGGRQRNRERHDQQADQRADQPIDRDAGKHIPGNGAACVVRAAANVSIDDACRRKQHDQGKQELVHGVGQ
ncbi:hypothetical protein [Achromobacter marplatensis]|uniref:hypothetical protein n=1 Tax=Achromobacter marplatensis TaxID=470868 RepID=UPI0028E884FE|nr:hypothetical protein [Achromobacter marplatensis]